MLSPDLAFLLQAARCNPNLTASSEIFVQSLRRCRTSLSRLISMRRGGDRVWSLWLRTARGSLADFGDYDEYLSAGEVSSREEFESLWTLEYPEPAQWWRLAVVTFRDEVWVTLARELQFGADLTLGSIQGIDPTNECARELLTWLVDAVAVEVDRVCADPHAYNTEIKRSLPLRKRYGRILRSDLWQAAGGPDEVEREFASIDLEAFGHLSDNPDDVGTLPEMSLAAYLDCCRICYKANKYKRLDEAMSPVEQYRVMADGRDDGMLNLPPDDSDAFLTWFETAARLGHPFEIRAGGSRTHISLYPERTPHGWRLVLSGFSKARIVETAKMALALRRAGRPCVVVQKEEMLRMLAGVDLVGIVPDDTGLGYNHLEFPKEDRVYSFVHLWMIEEACDSVPESIFWYALEELHPRR